MRIHDRQRQRYRCCTCGHTCSARRGTMFEGLRKATDLIVIVVTLLAYGCPIQAIVHAFDVAERTVASWRDRAGQQCETVHQAIVEQGKLNLMHVQADAHSDQSTRKHCLDGASHDGADPLVVGRSGEPEARQRTGRWMIATSASLLPEDG
jgi:hypothetical protein